MVSRGAQQPPTVLPVLCGPGALERRPGGSVGRRDPRRLGASQHRQVAGLGAGGRRPVAVRHPGNRRPATTHRYPSVGSLASSRGGRGDPTVGPRRAGAGSSPALRLSGPCVGVPTSHRGRRRADVGSGALRVAGQPVCPECRRRGTPRDVAPSRRGRSGPTGRDGYAPYVVLPGVQFRGLPSARRPNRRGAVWMGGFRR